MKIFKNKELTEEVKILNLGIVKAGETKKFVFYVLNDSYSELVELSFIVEHEEITFLEFPTKLKANKFGKLIIEWTPSITLKKGLNVSFQVTGAELWS